MTKRCCYAKIRGVFLEVLGVASRDLVSLGVLEVILLLEAAED